MQLSSQQEMSETRFTLLTYEMDRSFNTSNAFVKDVTLSTYMKFAGNCQAVTSRPVHSGLKMRPTGFLCSARTQRVAQKTTTFLSQVFLAALSAAE